MSDKGDSPQAFKAASSVRQCLRWVDGLVQGPGPKACRWLPTPCVIGLSRSPLRFPGVLPVAFCARSNKVGPFVRLPLPLPLPLPMLLPLEARTTVLFKGMADSAQC